MTKRTCENCRWWDAGPTGSGSCHRQPPVAGSDDVFPVTHGTDRCGEWADASITPEQEEMRELTRRFAVALISAGMPIDDTTWNEAAKFAAAEPQIQKEGAAVNNEQQTQQADDPSGDGWRDVGPDEILQTGDMFWVVDHWEATHNAGTKSFRYGNGYRRRIEPQQPSDSDPGIVEDLRRRLAECEVLLDEAERSGQQVNAELQQLREQLATSQHLAEMSRRQVADEAGKIEQLKEQVQTLTWERDRYRNQLAGAIEHSKAPEAQAQLLDRLQAWLRPVLELVAEHPEDASPLAVAVLGFLPGIASRLIEE